MATVYSTSESDLIRLAQRGDRNAFNELVRIHATGVMNVIYRMCGDQHLAEDAAQEAFLSAWLHLSSYQARTPVRNWLYRIAVNAALDLLRKEVKILPDDVEDLELSDSRPGPEELAQNREQSTLIQKAILALPDACRAVLILREYEELSYQEISSTLDIPIGTVMSRLNYARSLLREKLEPRLTSIKEVENV